VLQYCPSAHRGDQVIGWTIWEWPRVLIEAEFHCVWRQSDGTLLDITPKPVQVPRILFLPDPVRRYQARQVDNIRKPLDRDPAIKRFCDLSAKYHRAVNEGDLAEYHGPVTLSEQATRDEIEREQLKMLLVRRYGANNPNLSPMSISACIEKKDRVAIRIRYNGYIHKAVGLREEERESSRVRIFFEQLPKGFRDEHGAHQIDYVFKTHCIVPDSSDEHGWIATEEVDLDFFARLASTES
jgi:hypothetical protein